MMHLKGMPPWLCRLLAACATAVLVLVPSWLDVAAVAAQPPANAGALTAAPAATPGDEDLGSDDESVVLNFEGADIREVIYSLATALDINYWLDPRVQGQVTVRTSSPISRDDLFPVFHHILRSNGYVAINDGELYMIVPAEEGKTHAAAPSHEGAQVRAQDQFVMELVKVHHVNAQEIATLIQTFVSPGGDVLAYPRSNLVVVSDLASNATRLAELVKTFDTDSFGDLSAKIYKVEHASVDEISEELQAVLEGYQFAETGAGLYVIPLPRINSIAVISFDATVFSNVEYWLKVLDVPAAGGGLRQVYVYMVENTKAADLATILNDVFADQGARVETSTTGRSGAAGEAGLGVGGGFGGSRGQRNTGGLSSSSSSRSSLSSSRSRQTAGGGGGLGGDAGGAATGTRTRARTGGLRRALSRAGGGAGAGEPGSLFEQEVSIVADEVTNALVVLATPRDYKMVRSVLTQLDIVPRQVLIEVLLAEITLGEGMTFGVEQSLVGSETTTNADSGTSATTSDPGGSFMKLFGEDLRLTGGAGGTTGGLIGTLTHFRNGKPVYDAVLTALANHSEVKLLSRPHILTADNQEASILIGNEVPIITQQTDSNITQGGTTSILQNVQYRDTGIIVHVLPQVNSQGLVNMQIRQEVSEIGDASVQIQGIASPTFTTRETQTTVVVQSGETIVIGGIIQENKNTSRAGIPYLMDIPVLGQLFRTDTQSVRRTELIALITPYVVRDREEARSVTDEFKRRTGHVLDELQADEHPETSHTVILDQSSF